MKRIFSLLLALCLIGSMVPFQAFAAEDADASEILTEEVQIEAPVVNDDESIVESIVVPDRSIMVGTGGYYMTDYDEELDQWFTWWYYEVAPTEFYVYYKDGTSATYSYDTCQELTGYGISCQTSQSYLTPWDIGTFTVTAEFMGVTCEFQVTIEPSPVERIEVAPMSMMVGTNGWMDGYYDENDEWVPDAWFRYNEIPAEFTVYYCDGSVVTYDTNTVAEITGYYLDVTSDQSYENQWGVGEHVATATFMSVSCQFEIVITGSNVERIEIPDIIVMEGTNGTYQGHHDDDGNWVENSWYEYSITPSEFTVYYLDGDVVTYDFYGVYDETGMSMDLQLEQSYYNQWGVGSHTVTATFAGVSAEYQVIIEPTPVERIEISDFTLIEGSSGYWTTEEYWDDDLWDWVKTDSYFRYDVEPEEVTVYYKDGSVATYDPIWMTWETGYETYFQHDQSFENQWGIGTHTVTFAFMGVTCQYDVTIVETPVERIEVAPVTLIENLNGVWHGDYMEVDGEWIYCEWFGYNAAAETFTVYYKDGTVATYNRYEGLDQTGCEDIWTDSQSVNNQWGIGTHTATVSFMGVTCEYAVNIVEHPIERIEVPDLTLVAGEDGVWETEYWDEEVGDFLPCKWFYYFYNAQEVTVYYKDGTVAHYTYSEAEEELGYMLYSYSDQSYYNPWSEGTYTCTADLMNITCTYNVHIVEPTDAEGLFIVSQPQNYYGKVNSTATFSVGVNKEDVSYQWYFSTDGVNWSKSTATGAQTDTLSIRMASYRVGQMYRCVITDTLRNEVTTDTVILSLPASTIEIVAHPQDYFGAAADVAAFTAEATGEGITYRWYYSNTNGETWAESWSEGYNTATLNPVLRDYNSGRLFKCLITDANGNTEWTDAAIMALDSSEIIIHTQPADYAGAVNELTEFTVEAEGKNLVYCWQVSTDGGETWANSFNEGYTTPTLKVRLYAYRSGYMYRCVITSGKDYRTVTDAATLTQRPSTAKITEQPLNTGGMAGGEAVFSVKATGSNLTYQWEYSKDGGTVWAKSGMDGSKTDTMNVQITDVRDGYLYRCAITDDSGVTIYSDAAKLTVGIMPMIWTQPQDCTVAEGETAIFSCNAMGERLNYQWQYSNDGGVTWSDSSATGATTSNISIEALAHRNGQMYRCIISNEIGSIVTDAATLTVI